MRCIEINNKEVRTLIPNDKDDCRPNRAYFMIDENAFFIYKRNGLLCFGNPRTN